MHIALAQEPKFTPKGIHGSTFEYLSYFEVHTAECGAGTLNIESKSFDELAAQKLYHALEKDLQVISDFAADRMTDFSVYVVGKLVNGRMQLSGDAVYCTAADVLDGGYRQWLVGATFDIEEPWKAFRSDGSSF